MARRWHDLGVCDLNPRTGLLTLHLMRVRTRASKRCAGTISPGLAAAPIKARQACFRPVIEDGLPLIGALPGIDGAYVATGHSVWGMLNAPATGEGMSELILECGASRRPRAGHHPRRRCRGHCSANQRATVGVGHPAMVLTLEDLP